MRTCSVGKIVGADDRSPHILSSFAPLLAWPVLLTTNGCSSLVDLGAHYWPGVVKTAFVEAESCPAERVTVGRTTRPDWLKAPPSLPVPPPPPEVAANPARLKVYNDEHAPPADPHANPNHAFYVGQGCGHADVYECRVVSGPTVTTIIDEFQCSPVVAARK